MNTELETTLVQSIRETYKASIELADAAKENASAAINKALECGQHLISAKSALKHGQWLDWFQHHSAVFGFQETTARKYIRLAEFVGSGGSLDDAQGMRQAFITAGILLEPERPSGSQSAHGSSSSWLTFLTKSTEQINKLKEKAPVDEWPETTRSTMKEKLRPMVELYELL